MLQPLEQARARSANLEDDHRAATRFSDFWEVLGLVPRLWQVPIFTPAVDSATRDWIGDGNCWIIRGIAHSGWLARALACPKRLKLTRFRGHPRICVKGVHDAQQQGKEASTISA